MVPFPRGRRDQKTIKTIKQNVRKVNILELGDYIIWNQHKKCIQISTNMTDIGLESEFENLETNQSCMDGETNGREQSIKK